jgi:ABC-2 type transport system permease protein
MNAFAGTSRLFRLALRRDRVTLTGCLVVLSGLLFLFTLAFAHDLPTQADVLRETRLMAGNAGFRMLSLPSGASLGAYVMDRSWVTLAVLAAVMSILCVVRHTRQNEETGRAELLGAGVVGQCAPLAAAVAVALGANLALAPLAALGLIAAGQPAAGSFAAGAAITAVGVAFTGAAAVTTQVSRSARGASGLAFAALAVSFLVSGLGNVLGHVAADGTVAHSAWPGWLTPIGWGYQLRPFGDEQWWLLELVAASTAGLLALAGLLVARRDLGAGLLPERMGRRHASAVLRQPFGIGLVWRLQRTTFCAWLAVLTGFGLIFGSVTESAGRTIAHVTGAGALSAWLTPVTLMGGIAAAIYAVQALLRMRDEEARGRLEPVLAAAVSRPRWMLAHVLSAVLGAAALLLAYAAAAGLTAAWATGTAGVAGDVLRGAAAELPAVLAMAALVVAVVALVPRRATAVSWLLLAAAVFLSPLFQLDLPRWLVDASPFTHQPAPTVDVSGVAAVWLLLVAGGLLAAGLAVFRRRDLRPD